MKNNLIIWFIGSNATGKTTQAALLHLYFRRLFDEEKKNHLNRYVQKVVDGIPVKYTLLSTVSANIGHFNHPITSELEDKTTMTCGTDTINKKEQIKKSVELALREVPIVVVEGVMATATWIDFLAGKDKELILIHMSLDLETNLKRLLQRRSNKKQIDFKDSLEALTEKTLKNIEGKVRGFKGMFEKLKKEADVAFSVDASKSAQWVHFNIVKKIKQSL